MITSTLLQVSGLQINKTRVEAALLSKKEKVAGHAVRAVHWIIQEGLPIAKYPRLMELLREYEVQDITELNVTSQVTYSSRHTATDLLEVFSEQVDEEALQQLTESPFIAVLADETTDITTKKRVGLYVKTADKTLKVKTRFLTNVQLNSGSEQAIAHAIEKEMNSRGISPERIIALGSDGASVMTGPGKGVTGLLRRKNPHLLPIVKRWQVKDRKLFTVKGGGKGKRHQVKLVRGPVQE